MTRQFWRGANLLNPVPAVLITCRDENGRDNVMTAAWAGTVCSDPVMVSVSIRKSRYSHDIIQNSKEFVMCLTNEKLTKYTDYVGVHTGKKVDKFKLEGDLKVHREDAKCVNAPLIKESPLCLECKVKQIIELGSHDMFIAEVVSSDVDEQYLDENGRLDLGRANLIGYVHGEYYTLGKKIGKFGYSVRKKRKYHPRRKK